MTAMDPKRTFKRSAKFDSHFRIAPANGVTGSDTEIDAPSKDLRNEGEFGAIAVARLNWQSFHSGGPPKFEILTYHQPGQRNPFVLQRECVTLSLAQGAITQ